MIYLELFLTFLKVGAVSFGGGYGMISLLTEEVVGHGWMLREEFTNFIAVAESTPGPIAINMATFVGASQGALAGGVWGSLLGAFLATLGVVLPAFIIILTIAALARGLLKFAGVKSFLSGIKPVVVGLITATALTMLLGTVFNIETVQSTFSFDYKALIIFSVVVATSLLVKKFLKKKISPILLILISACLGMLFYGVIP